MLALALTVAEEANLNGSIHPTSAAQVTLLQREAVAGGATVLRHAHRHRFSKLPLPGAHVGASGRHTALAEQGRHVHVPRRPHVHSQGRRPGRVRGRHAPARWLLRRRVRDVQLGAGHDGLGVCVPGAVHGGVAELDERVVPARHLLRSHAAVQSARARRADAHGPVRRAQGRAGRRLLPRRRRPAVAHTAEVRQDNYTLFSSCCPCRQGRGWPRLLSSYLRPCCPLLTFLSMLFLSPVSNSFYILLLFSILFPLFPDLA